MHRHHPAIRKLKRILAMGGLDPVDSVRATFHNNKHSRLATQLQCSIGANAPIAAVGHLTTGCTTWLKAGIISWRAHSKHSTTTQHYGSVSRATSSRFVRSPLSTWTSARTLFSVAIARPGDTPPATRFSTREWLRVEPRGASAKSIPLSDPLAHSFHSLSAYHPEK